MLRSLLVACVLSMACASPEAPTTPEAPARADAPATAEPAAPAEPTETPAATAWHWHDEFSKSTRARDYLLGVMGQTGVEHCPGGGFDREWLHVRPTIGRVAIGSRVSEPDVTVLDPLMDQPVLVTGFFGPPRPTAALDDPAPSLEPCLPAQMRSDWRITPRGLLIERDPAPAETYMSIDAVRRLHELQAREDGDHVVVTLINPTPVPLVDVELRMHYEGCFGKPGTRAQATVFGDVGVGAKVSARVPKLSRSPGAAEGRHEFRAYSVQVVGRNGERTVEHQHEVVIDLDVPLDRLGVAVECPKK